jgi:hypothetical protein
MSLQTALNRWRRYQVARLEGLIEGLAREARRIPSSTREHEIRVLGAAMLLALDEHCQSLAEELGADFATGRLADIPDFRFERL